MSNKDYIVVENGLFKDSFTEEAVVNKELRQRVVQDPVIFGTAGEHTTAEEMWIDLINEIPTPEVNLSVMTEQEIINYLDQISQEE